MRGDGSFFFRSDDSLCELHWWATRSAVGLFASLHGKYSQGLCLLARGVCAIYSYPSWMVMSGWGHRLWNAKVNLLFMALKCIAPLGN